MASVYKSLSKGESKTAAEGEKDAPKHRQRVLMLTSRGVTYRHRHLLSDLYSLMPHAKKDVKLDTKTTLYQLNEIAEMDNCNNVLFFEARKGKDLYVWMSKAPNGPTVKFHLQNLHTMSELHFPGNCLKGSRPILSFDATFDSQPHLRVIRELLTHVFGVTPSSRKTKPFVDHVMGFTIADGKVWIRVYQVNETEIPKGDKETNGTPTEAQGAVNQTPDAQTKAVKGHAATKLSLVEIGPRFVLTPIVIQESSFGGPIIYENKEFVSPNMVRRELRLSKANRHMRRSEGEKEGKLKRGTLGLQSGAGRRRREGDELDDRALYL